MNLAVIDVRPEFSDEPKVPETTHADEELVRLLKRKVELRPAPSVEGVESYDLGFGFDIVGGDA